MLQSVVLQRARRDSVTSTFTFISSLRLQGSAHLRLLRRHDSPDMLSDSVSSQSAFIRVPAWAGPEPRAGRGWPAGFTLFASLGPRGPVGPKPLSRHHTEIWGRDEVKREEFQFMSRKKEDLWIKQSQLTVLFPFLFFNFQAY